MSRQALRTDGSGEAAGALTGRAAAVRSVFTRIAGRYDGLVRLVTAGGDRRWRGEAARVVAAAPPGPVLDVGTGTGSLAWSVAALDPRRLVVGLDFSQGMLRVAERRWRRPGDSVRAVAGDALALPFADRTFGCVAGSFVLRSLDGGLAGLREMRRVTRPGGWVVILEVTSLRWPLLSALFDAYVRRILPWLGAWMAGDGGASRRLPQSANPLIAPDRLARLMEQVGLEEVRACRLALGMVALLVGIA